MINGDSKKNDNEKKQNILLPRKPLELSSLYAYFILLYAISFPLICASFLFPMASPTSPIIGGLSASPPNVFFALGGLVMFAAQLRFLVLLYRAWKNVIAELRKRNLTPSVATAGRALGFAFIPFFNLYWLFIAFGKLVKDCNRLAEAQGRSQRLPVWYGYGIPVLLFLMIIHPLTGAPFFLIGVYVLYPVFISIVISYLSGVNEAVKTERVKEITAYGDLFDWKTRGHNLYAALAFLIALVISAVAPSWIRHFIGAPGLFMFWWQALRDFALSPLLIAACWYGLSGLVKNFWLKSLLFGGAVLLSYALLHLPDWIVFQQVPIPALAVFAFGFLLMLGFNLAVRLGGARLGAFLTGACAASLIPVSSTAFIFITPLFTYYVWIAVSVVTAVAAGALAYGGLVFGMARKNLGLWKREIVKYGE